jgi:hypothetical protein
VRASVDDAPRVTFPNTGAAGDCAARYVLAVDFDETVAAIEALAGIEVEALVTGGGGAWSVATLQGVLGSHRDVQPLSDLPQQIQDAAGEVATTFRVGDHWGNIVTLWPSRFLDGRLDAVGRAVTVTTADGTVRISRNRPWID